MINGKLDRNSDTLDDGSYFNIYALEKRLHKKLTLAQGELNRLMKRDFACAADAKIAADKLSQSWKYHLLGSLKIETNLHYAQAGRPRKDQKPEQIRKRVEVNMIAFCR